MNRPVQSESQNLAREVRRTDLAGRLYGIETRGENDAVLQRHGYRHDKAGRRVRTTREDGSYWAYGYNDRGEVNSGNKHLPDGTPLAGQQFGYDYDALGNRNWAKSGGDANGENLRTVTYEANALNQYTEIVSPGSFDVIGRAPADDTVTVNGQATQRQGDRFRAEVSADNSTAAVWQDITVSDGTPPDIKGSSYLPKATVIPDHDEDGNLLFDGRWDYVWDAENRLVSMTTNPTAQATGEPYRKLVFSYDWMGKRIRKQVFDSPTATTTLEDLRFAYDGWNMVVEYTGTGGTLTLLRGYTWGNDLGGSEQGAGGVGGLLSVRQGGASNAASYDGNGNIVGWVDALGELASRQEFDSFGNRIIQEGSLDMPVCFSTKYRDKETGLLYYGYRYFDSVTGRWPTRDPIEEEGGENIYGFVGNDPCNTSDFLGLDFIVAGTRPLDGLIGGFGGSGLPANHLSIVYFAEEELGCSRLKVGDEFTRNSIPNCSRLILGVELLLASGYGWETTKWTDRPGGNGRVRRPIRESIGISTVEQLVRMPERFHVVRTCANDKHWKTIQKAVASYAFGEQGLFGRLGASLKKWPQSRYDLPPEGNNSNSFVRKVLSDSGYDVSDDFFNQWNHPGAFFPDSVVDHRKTPIWLRK